MPSVVSRTNFLSLGFLIFFGLCLARLFYWQVVLGGELSAQARSQHISFANNQGQRGVVYARDGSILVGSEPVWLTYAYLPSMKNKPNDLAEKIAALTSTDSATLSEEKNRLSSLLSKTDTSWVPLHRPTDRDLRKKIEELKEPAIGFDVYERRMYPEGSMAAILTGFVGKDESGDEQGYFGLEGYYDLLLSSKKGGKSGEASARGGQIAGADFDSVEGRHGVSLHTSIDPVVQLTIESELIDSVVKYGAESGTVAVIETETGSILGMASWPSFEQANFNGFDAKTYRNTLISDSFEPGSIFKPLVIAAGIDAGVISPDTICSICVGPYQIDKYSIRTWDNKYHPGSTMTDVLKNSDNVGMVYVGDLLGKDRLVDYYKRFGFGERTGVDLQGEIASPLRPGGDWGPVEFATSTFGQGIVVTQLQILAAVNAIANKGYWVAPSVVDKFTSGDWEKKMEKAEPKKVINEKTAELVTNMMVAAVKKGEAKWAAPKGFEISGKTGTAQIAVGGKYDEEQTYASFIGFAPSKNPRFTMLVTLKKPTTSPWASETAAPSWFRIATKLLDYYGVQPSQ
jgi:cell division protein FtsI (penicillin-binding protein 3)